MQSAERDEEKRNDQTTPVPDGTDRSGQGWERPSDREPVRASEEGKSELVEPGDNEKEKSAGDSPDSPEDSADGEERKGAQRARSGRPRKRQTPRVKNLAEAKAVLECLLFASIEPLSLRQIREFIHPVKLDELQKLIVELQNEYDSRGGGLQIVEVAGGYQMATRPHYADWLAPLLKRKHRGGLSPAMLETLAIISYRQPIIRAEIDAIRGVDSSGVIRGLLEMGLVEVVGQKQVPGRPNLYGTTRAFLKYFGLKSLSDLPSIDSLREQFKLTQA